MRNKKDLKKMSEPLLDYLYENGTPHTTIIITQSGIKVLDGKEYVPFEHIESTNKGDE